MHFKLDNFLKNTNYFGLNIIETVLFLRQFVLREKKKKRHEVAITKLSSVQWNCNANE